MKCYVCRHDGTFGEITSGLEGLNLTGRMNGEPVEKIRMYVCPICGAIHTDMDNKIQDTCRIPKVKKIDSDIEKNLTMEFF